jgi:hypothetical protein
VRYYCICGHEEPIHRWWGSSVCWTKDKTGALICSCWGFKLDNLRYLEELSNGRE